MSGGSTTTESPKASGLSISTATSGKCIALLWGRNKIPLNVISYHDFEAVRHEEKQSAGKGGGSMKSVSYTYKVGLMLGACRGPVASIPRVFNGKSIGTPSSFNFATVLGVWDQSVPAELLASPTLGDDGKLAYRGVAGLVSYKFDLGGSESMPNITAEVDTGHGFSAAVLDASPALVVREYLSIAGIPASSLTELNDWEQFCIAVGLFFSPAYTEREAARNAVKRLIGFTGCDVYESQGKIRIINHADAALTGNNTTWTPNLTPVVDLTIDDFLEQDAPIKITDEAQSDTRNIIRVKFANRAKDYAEDYGVARDLASIQKYGEREEEFDGSKEITEAAVASTVAQLLLNRRGVQRFRYEFKLGWKFARLERGDLVTITHDGMHLDRQLVRITEIEEDAESGDITIKAEQVLVGSSTPSSAGTEINDAYSVDHNIAPGAINAPVIFEPPLALSGRPQVWIGTSGGDKWGGCDVWISDDGETYSRAGRITTRARHGYLTAALPVGAAIDSANTVAVDLGESGGSIVGGTEQNALDLLTLSYVGGELLAYRDATLTAPNQYGLKWLVRGVYGTAINAHAAGAQFMRLDEAVGKFDYGADKIGRQIYIKLQSFNVYTSAFVDLADVEPIPYTLVGAALADVTGLALEQPFIGASCKIKWDAVDAATSYTVEVWAGSPQVLRRTVQVTNCVFEYSAEDATANGGPWRTLTFRVKAVSATGASSNWANLSASNPAPAAPTGVRASVGFGSIAMSWDAPTDTDMAGYVVHLSGTSGFTPATMNRVSDDTSLSVVLFRTADGAALEVGKTYYLRIAAYDLFGRDQLNYCGEVAVTMTAIPAALLELQNLGPSNFDLATAAAIANMQALSSADLEALAQIDTEALASMSTQLEDAREAVQKQALALLDAVSAQSAEADKRRAAAAAIVAERQTRITDMAAMASDLLALLTRMAAAEAGVSSAMQAISQGDNALATRIDQTNATVASNTASTTTQLQSLANTDTALGQRIDTVSATQSTDKAALQAAISAADTARASGDSANAASISTVSARLNSGGDVASAISAAATAAATAQATADGKASASSVSQLTTTVNGNTASIGTLTQSVSGVMAQWSVSMTAGSKVAGVRLIGQDGVTAFDVLTDVFRVSLPNGTGSKQVFTVGSVDGQSAVGVSGDLLIDGTVSTRALVANSVTADKLAANAITADSAVIADAAITSARIADAAVTNVKIGNVIHSSGFNGSIDGAGSITSNGNSGWAISKVGKAVFHDVFVRGDIHATSVSANTITADNIVNAAISSVYEAYGSYPSITFTSETAFSALVMYWAQPYKSSGEDSGQFWVKVDGNTIAYHNSDASGTKVFQGSAGTHTLLLDSLVGGFSLLVLRR